jgi:recombination protein RecA
MFGDPTTTAGGGMALEFYSSMRIRLSSSKQIKDNLGNSIGINVNVKCIKNKCFRPFMEVRGVRLFFDKGINPFSGLLELMLQTGRIEAVKPAGTYKIKEPWAGGQEITFKSNKERNDIPAEVLLKCPAVVDATDASQVQYYIDMFGDALVEADQIVEVDVEGDE